MERRTRKATVRLTEEELARLKEAARRAGWSQEAYLRALIGGIDPRPKPPPDYLAMTRELHAIGNNLNQIARQTNAAKDLPVELRGPLLELLRSLKVGADKLDDVIDRLSER